MNLIGDYYVLANLPIWATAMFLFFGTLGVIHVGRDYFEGLPYQVSYSAQFGDAMLFGAVLIAVGILHRGGSVVPEWLQSNNAHVAILVTCFAFGVIVSILTIKGRSGKAMDVYHDVIIAPLILYLAITLLPLIWLNGTKTEMVSTTWFIIIWGLLVIFDIKANRMNQRRWLENHGVVLRP
ncbi:MAG: hypothetical protein UY07_C0022G0024 [Parcubacteria group bacterium GW2011_GWA1_47_8]|nr:MAG: hypothetical protein UY07_C0022G0024 [Parcubacteria group bacterium GW2011_GWA1_47_8]KKW07881.1 MAG: hypothetical protein UY42_C0004G0023 [Parcubacteria group bacterium GW2011_GWA2_49_16]